MCRLLADGLGWIKNNPIIATLFIFELKVKNLLESELFSLKISYIIYSVKIINNIRVYTIQEKSYE